MRALQRRLRPALRRSRCAGQARRSLLAGLLRRRPRVVLFPLLGGEFMPKLEEGNFWIRATLPTSISLEQSAKYVGRMRRHRAGAPPARWSRSSRSSGAPTTAPTSPASTTSSSSRRSSRFDEWPRGLTKEKLTDELSGELAEAFPGVVFNFSQMIADNVEEAISGVKGENTVKVFGPDLKENERHGDAIVDVMEKVRGRQGPRHVPLARPAQHRDHPRPRSGPPATASTPATSRR